MSNLRATVTSKSSSSNIILNNEDKYNEEEYNELEETCEVAEDMDVAEDADDVWDDSALINAWDKAMLEYQTHHSLKAKAKQEEVNGSSAASARSKQKTSTKEKAKQVYKSSTSATKRPQQFDNATTRATKQKLDNGKDNKNTKESSQQKTFYPYYPYPPYYGEPLGNNPSPSTQFYQPPPPMESQYSHYAWHSRPIPPPPQMPPISGSGNSRAHSFIAQTSTNGLSNYSYFVDDEALSNLLMAWYFSGYYTGLEEGVTAKYIKIDRSNDEVNLTPLLEKIILT
ncbi:1038_t:CDS:2 [Paraglomus brasilianum]|uniref:1038_t:CDS:1 n=1 Tax=Paraglomus brasilianum TaxID=144538 RepID=A0A9N9CRQ3_9GLOM|nr:1038_t:CDS:2 [Paraglomus brasilianum]